MIDNLKMWGPRQWRVEEGKATGGKSRSPGQDGFPAALPLPVGWVFPGEVLPGEFEELPAAVDLNLRFFIADRRAAIVGQ